MVWISGLIDKPVMTKSDTKHTESGVSISIDTGLNAVCISKIRFIRYWMHIQARL